MKKASGRNVVHYNIIRHLNKSVRFLLTCLYHVHDTVTSTSKKLLRIGVRWISQQMDIKH